RAIERGLELAFAGGGEPVYGCGRGRGACYRHRRRGLLVGLAWVPSSHAAGRYGYLKDGASPRLSRFLIGNLSGMTERLRRNSFPAKKCDLSGFKPGPFS